MESLYAVALLGVVRSGAAGPLTFASNILRSANRVQAGSRFESMVKRVQSAVKRAWMVGVSSCSGSSRCLSGGRVGASSRAHFYGYSSASASAACVHPPHVPRSTRPHHRPPQPPTTSMSLSLLLFYPHYSFCNFNNFLTMAPSGAPTHRIPPPCLHGSPVRAWH